MDATNRIEKLDKLRFILLKLTTIAFALWYGMNIIAGIIQDPTLEIIAGLIGLCGGVFWIITLIKLVRLSRDIRRDHEAKKALNDELFLYNRNKSFVAGFTMVMCVAVIFSAVTIFADISGLLVTKIIIFTGVVGTLSASWYYNRG